MDKYRQSVIKALQRLGKSYEWTEWAINQIDLQHYWRKYFAQELAELIVAYESELY